MNKFISSLEEFSSFKNRKKIDLSKKCWCYYCLKQFSSDKITEWWDEDENGVGQTAVCPFCHIDSVIGDSEADITEELLLDMRKHWFSI